MGLKEEQNPECQSCGSMSVGYDCVVAVCGAWGCALEDEAVDVYHDMEEVEVIGYGFVRHVDECPVKMKLVYVLCLGM